jgi:putative addiction module component (TIGR02574 family)
MQVELQGDIPKAKLRRALESYRCPSSPGSIYSARSVAMSSDAVRLLEDALKLPEPDRADLASCLLASLDQEDTEPLDPSWEKEIQRRLEEIDSGKAELVPWEEARKRIFADA